MQRRVVVALVAGLAAVSASWAGTSFLGFTAVGRLPRADGALAADSTVVGQALAGRRELTAAELAAPPGLPPPAQLQWNLVCERLGAVLAEQNRLFSGEAYRPGSSLYGHSMASADPTDARWGEVELVVAAETAALVARYRAVREACAADPAHAEARLRDVAAEAQAVWGSLAAVVERTSRDVLSDRGVPVANADAEAGFFRRFVAPEAREGLVVDEGGGSPLVGQWVVMTRSVKSLRLDLKLFRAAPGPGASERDWKRYHEDMRKALFSSTGDPTRLVAGGPPSGQRFMVRGVLRDGQGRIVAYLLARNATGSSLFIVPVPDPETGGRQERPFRADLSHPGTTPGRAAGARSPADGAALAGAIDPSDILRSALVTLQSLTSLDPVLGATSGASPAQRVAQCTPERSARIRAEADALHALLHGNKDAFLRCDYGVLRELYDALAAVEASLNPVLEHYATDRTRWGEAAPLQLGSAQNSVALCVAMVCEKYRFDHQEEVGEDARGPFVRKRTRVGNFYKVGTAAREAVEEADYLLSGPYSCTRYTSEATGRARIRVHYQGLNRSDEKRNPPTNPFAVYVLDPAHEDYPSLVAQMSEVADHAGAAYHRPLAACPALADGGGGVVLARAAVSNAEVIRSGDEGDLDLEFDLPVPDEEGAPRRFVVYQEAAGLTYVPWVDYDEATTTVTAWDCRLDERVDRDAFRIIVDGSGTMVNLFGAVAESLRREFADLQMEDYLEPGAKLKPVVLFGSDPMVAANPYNVADMCRRQASGGSEIRRAVLALFGVRPPKPWVLLILSDFNQSGSTCFAAETWATSSSVRPPVPPLMVRDGAGELRINCDGDPAKGWPGLQRIYLVAVQKVLEGRSGVTVAPLDALWIKNDRSFRTGRHGIWFDDLATHGLDEAVRSFLDPIRETYLEGRTGEAGRGTR